MRRILAGFALLLVATFAQAQVNALPPTRHILVYGDAQARAIPDRFRIDVEFSALDRDPGAARVRVERAMSDVLARLRKAGVPNAEVVATSLSIEPEQRYDERARAQVFAGTRVKRSLTARFDDKAALEAFLGGLQTSQELSVSDVTTELSDEATLREALRARSIASTREKAEAIAKSYGTHIGAVYSVSDVAPSFEYGVREGHWPTLYEWNPQSRNLDRVVVTGSRSGGTGASAATALQTGYVTFTDRIYAVFLLAD